MKRGKGRQKPLPTYVTPRKKRILLEVKKLAEQGLTHQQICEKMKKHPTTVRQYMNWVRRGVPETVKIKKNPFEKSRENNLERVRAWERKLDKNSQPYQIAIGRRYHSFEDLNQFFCSRENVENKIRDIADRAEAAVRRKEGFPVYYKKSDGKTETHYVKTPTQIIIAAADEAQMSLPEFKKYLKLTGYMKEYIK